MKRIESLVYHVQISKRNHSYLVLCHGLLVDHTMFTPLLPAVQTRWNLLMPELWWHGANNPAPLPVSLEKQAELIAQMIQEEANGQPVHVLGYSMGGVIAQLLTLRFPHLVRSLILSSTFAYKPISSRERAEKRLFTYLVKRFTPKGIALLATPLLLTMPQVPLSLRKRYQKNVARMKTEALLQYIEELYTINLLPHLKSIVQPTCVIGGTSDLVTPFHHAQTLASSIPNATLVPFPKADHILIFTHKEPFQRTVLEFLSQQEGSS